MFRLDDSMVNVFGLWRCYDSWRFC